MEIVRTLRDAREAGVAEDSVRSGEFVAFVPAAVRAVFLPFVEIAIYQVVRPRTLPRGFRVSPRSAQRPLAACDVVADDQRLRSGRFLRKFPRPMCFRCCRRYCRRSGYASSCRRWTSPPPSMPAPEQSRTTLLYTRIQESNPYCSEARAIPVPPPAAHSIRLE